MCAMRCFLLEPGVAHAGVEIQIRTQLRGRTTRETLADLAVGVVQIAEQDCPVTFFLAGVGALGNVNQQSPALQLGDGFFRRARLRELDQSQTGGERGCRCRGAGYEKLAAAQAHGLPPAAGTDRRMSFSSVSGLRTAPIFFSALSVWQPKQSMVTAA